MADRLLPLATMEALLKKAGAERVSEDAKVALKEILETHAESIAKKAVSAAMVSGRKTVQASDIKQ